MNDEVRDSYLKAGRIASSVRNEAAGMIKAGGLLLDVAEFTEAETERLGGRPAFPTNLAIDSVAAHYTPHSADPLRFQPGQLVKLDLGVHVNGYIADTAVTVEVSTDRWNALVGASRDALEIALESLAPGILVRSVGGMVGRAIKARGFEPVSNLTGHSLEQFNLHAGVSVPNVQDDSGADLKPGMAVAIEPFATTGVGRVAGRKSGNIYKLLRTRETGDAELDAMVGEIHSEFRFMPFSERWIAKRCERPDRILRRLLRHGAVATYPILSEVRSGMVSQAEHTVIIGEKGCTVTTR